MADFKRFELIVKEGDPNFVKGEKNLSSNLLAPRRIIGSWIIGSLNVDKGDEIKGVIDYAIKNDLDVFVFPVEKGGLEFKCLWDTKLEVYPDRAFRDSKTINLDVAYNPFIYDHVSERTRLFLCMDPMINLEDLATNRYIAVNMRGNLVPNNLPSKGARFQL
jgi:hypothetical protein